MKEGKVFAESLDCILVMTFCIAANSFDCCGGYSKHVSFVLKPFWKVCVYYQ